jgi:ketosteroid isomerase-like protein
MSEENVEIVRALFKAWDKRDPEAALAHIDPDVEVDMTGAKASRLDIGSDRGHDGLARVISAFTAAWDGLRWEADVFIDAGDTVIVWLRAFAKGRESGVPVDTRFASAYTLRDGLVVSWRGYDTLAAAAESAGV